MKMLLIIVALLGCIVLVFCAWKGFLGTRQDDMHVESPIPTWLKLGLTKDVLDTVLECPDKASKAQGRRYNFACYYYAKCSLLIKTSGNPERIIEIARTNSQ
jgi:hypothetical protein